MTTHAVIFLDYPPAVLNILATPVLWVIEQRGGYVCSLSTEAAQEKRGQSRPPLLSQIRLGHTELVFALQILRLARIVDLRLGQLVFEEATMVVPLFLFVLRMKLQRVASIFGILSQQSKIETLKRRGAFSRQFFTDALLFFESLDFMTAGATVLLDLSLPVFSQFRIVHEGNVLRSRLGRQREQIGRDVPGVWLGKPQVWHYRHILHLKLSAIVRTFRVQFGVEQKRQTVFRVIFRS